MIGKLMKYDLRSMLRKFLPLWAGLAALGLINGFTINHVLDNNRIQGLGNFLLGVLPLILLVVMFTVLSVLTLVYICQRFYQGLLGREGYLMFTLPVSNAEHILAKTLSALVLVLLTGVVFLLSGGLLMLALDPKMLLEGLKEIPGLFRELEPGRGIVWVMLEGLLFALVSIVRSVLHIYTAIAIGHLASRHRAGWSLLAYVGINTVLSTGLYSLAGIGVQSGMEWRIEEFYGYTNGMAVTAAGLGIMILIGLVLSLAFFFVTKYILDKNLNLE